MEKANKDLSPKPIEIVREDLGVTLRQFTVSDSGEIFKLIDGNREHLSQHGDDTAGKYKILQDVVDSIEKPSNPAKLRFAIRNKEGVYVGTINLTPESSTRAEIGYYLGREFTGKGYITKAAQALTDYAFMNLGYQELFGKVHKDNIASFRVLERAGYKLSRQEAEKLILARTS